MRSQWADRTGGEDRGNEARERQDSREEGYRVGGDAFIYGVSAPRALPTLCLPAHGRGEHTTVSFQPRPRAGKDLFVVQATFWSSCRAGC